MSLNFIGPGMTIPVTGQASSVAAGALFAHGGAVNEAWWGVCEASITGTAVALTTVDGRPILDEDVTQYGSGEGDIKVEGVFQFAVASGLAQIVTNFRVGDPVYASGYNGVAGPDVSGNNGDSDVTTLGMVQPAAAAVDTTRGLSLAGHVWKAAYLETNNASPFVGMWVVEAKLLGHPPAGLV